MIPSAIFEALDGDSILESYDISSNRIFELQSLDDRPVKDGYFVVINFEESTVLGPLKKGPRIMTIWVHHPMEKDRDYAPVDAILNRIEGILLGLEQTTGSDNVRVTCIMKQGRSRNLIDPAWKTIARSATYGVLYDETLP